MNKYPFLLFGILILISGCEGAVANSKPIAGEAHRTTVAIPSNPVLDSADFESGLKLLNADDSTAKQLRRFYKGRGYRYAWFTAKGLSDDTRTFWTLHNGYLTTFGDTAMRFALLHRDVDALLAADSSGKGLPKPQPRTELELTSHFFVYLNNAYVGKSDPAAMQWHIPRKALDPIALLSSFLNRSGQSIEDWEPINLLYKRLKKSLLQYSEIEKAGGWKQIISHASATYKPGDSSVLIGQLRQRLQIVNAGAKTGASTVYDSDLLAMVKHAQAGFGENADGIVTSALIKELNVPVNERIGQIKVNLERMRWLPEYIAGNFIGVNIPEFRLHMFSGEKKLFSIDIVVGQAAHNTVIFADKLQYIVFSPYWNVPPSIVRKEILPAIRRNRNYLARNNMERTGYEDGLPVIRQKPGGNNALGKVKFLFPNSYNIYFHDTPAKSLFAEDARAFSHGCMRVSDPLKLVNYLLRDQPEWTQEKIAKAMSSSVETHVTLNEELPVYITYFTAWVDSEGALNFRPDIYHHDKQVAQSLF